MCGVVKANAALVRRNATKAAEEAELHLIGIPTVLAILVEEDEGRQDNLVDDGEEANHIERMITK